MSSMLRLPAPRRTVILCNKLLGQPEGPCGFQPYGHLKYTTNNLLSSAWWLLSCARNAISCTGDIEWRWLYRKPPETSETKKTIFTSSQEFSHSLYRAAVRWSFHSKLLRAYERWDGINHCHWAHQRLVGGRTSYHRRVLSCVLRVGETGVGDVEWIMVSCGRHSRSANRSASSMIIAFMS